MYHFKEVLYNLHSSNIWKSKIEGLATMDYLSLLLLITFVLAIIHIFISTLGSQTSPSPKLPPGPYPLPIIGNILQLGQLPHQALTNLSKIYGPIMSLKLGNRTTIVISSPLIAKEALQKNDLTFSSRTIPDGIRALDHPKFSLIWMPPSNMWRTLRKTCNINIFSPPNDSALPKVSVREKCKNC